MSSAQKKKIPATLKNTLSFECEPVVRRLQSKGLSPSEARDLFSDVMRFMWLCASNPNSMFVPSKQLDFGWHTFLEFTKAYQVFCEKKLTRFVHHYPKEALPNSFMSDCGGGSECSASCSSGDSRTLGKKTGASLVEFTIETARAKFGKLSSNWNYSMNFKNLQSSS